MAPDKGSDCRALSRSPLVINSGSPRRCPTTTRVHYRPANNLRRAMGKQCLLRSTTGGTFDRCCVQTARHLQRLPVHILPGQAPLRSYAGSDRWELNASARGALVVDLNVSSFEGRLPANLTVFSTREIARFQYGLVRCPHFDSRQFQVAWSR